MSTTSNTLAMSALAIALTIGAPAAAQQEGSSLAAPSPPRGRVFGAGVGTRLGGRFGYTPWATPSTSAGFTGETLSLELSPFIDDHLSVDVSVGLGNTILAAALGAAQNGVVGLDWDTSVYLDWSFGDDVRLLVGPGLGFEVWTHRYPSSTALASYVSLAGQARVGFLLGVEILTTGRVFGFRVMTRPWLGLGAAYYDSGERFILSAAATLDLAFFWYTR